MTKVRRCVGFVNLYTMFIRKNKKSARPQAACMDHRIMGMIRMNHQIQIWVHETFGTILHIDKPALLVLTAWKIAIEDMMNEPKLGQAVQTSYRGLTLHRCVFPGISESFARVAAGVETIGFLCRNETRVQRELK